MKTIREQFISLGIFNPSDINKNKNIRDAKEPIPLYKELSKKYTTNSSNKYTPLSLNSNSRYIPKSLKISPEEKSLANTKSFIKSSGDLNFLRNKVIKQDGDNPISIHCISGGLPGLGKNSR
jgi:hypothetical protein